MKSPAERLRERRTLDDDMQSLHPTQRPCLAIGCPEIGAISYGGSWACRFHFGEVASSWPKITADRREAAEAFKGSDQVETIRVVDRQDVLARLRALESKFGSSPSKNWARKLLAREQAGEKLSPVQSSFAREALRISAGDEELA